MAGKARVLFWKKRTKKLIRLATMERGRRRTLQWIESFFASFCSRKEDFLPPATGQNLPPS
jgi:hypothetical protein